MLELIPTRNITPTKPTETLKSTFSKNERCFCEINEIDNILLLFVVTFHSIFSENKTKMTSENSPGVGSAFCTFLMLGIVVTLTFFHTHGKSIPEVQQLILISGFVS